jgi:hypothetical protein
MQDRGRLQLLSAKAARLAPAFEADLAALAASDAPALDPAALPWPTDPAAAHAERPDAPAPLHAVASLAQRLHSSARQPALRSCARSPLECSTQAC